MSEKLKLGDTVWTSFADQLFSYKHGDKFDTETVIPKDLLIAMGAKPVGILKKPLKHKTSFNIDLFTEIAERWDSSDSFSIALKINEIIKYLEKQHKQNKE